MGRGDRKTKKGKISIRSYGNARSHTAKKSAVGAKKAPVAKAAVAKKAPAAPAKKAPAKKSA